MATPICALAAATRRSAAAMSGRRSSSAEGTPAGTGGGFGGQRRRRQRQLGRRLADEHRDGVLELRALHADVDGLRLGRLDQRLRQRDVDLGGDPGGIAVLRQLQRLLVGDDGGLQQLPSPHPARAAGSSPAASSACALSRAVCRSPALACALASLLSTLRRTRPHRSTSQDTSPGQQVVRVDAACHRLAAQRRGLARARDGGAHAHRREIRRARSLHQCPRLLEVRLRNGDGLVGDVHLLDQRVQLRVVEDLPPFAARDLVLRLRHLPAFGLLERGRCVSPSASRSRGRPCSRRADKGLPATAQRCIACQAVREVRPSEQGRWQQASAMSSA